MVRENSTMLSGKKKKVYLRIFMLFSTLIGAEKGAQASYAMDGAIQVSVHRDNPDMEKSEKKAKKERKPVPPRYFNPPYSHRILILVWQMHSARRGCCFIMHTYWYFISEWFLLIVDVVGCRGAAYFWSGRSSAPGSRIFYSTVTSCPSVGERKEKRQCVPFLEFLLSLREGAKFSSPDLFLKWLKEFTIWFNGTFTVQSVDTPFFSVGALFAALNTRVCTQMQSSQLFVAACRAMVLGWMILLLLIHQNIPARIVGALNPIPVKGPVIPIEGDAQLPIVIDRIEDDDGEIVAVDKKRKTVKGEKVTKTTSAVSGKGKKKKGSDSSAVKSENQKKQSSKKREDKDARFIKVWVEVYSLCVCPWISRPHRSSHKDWICVDLLNNIVNSREDILSTKDKFGYVISFNSRRTIRDITPLYPLPYHSFP